MSWVVPGYSGPVVLSSKGEQKTRGRRYLLQAVPEDVRPAFSAFEGELLADVDLRWAHPSIAAALTRDPQLLEDVAHDAHQRAGAAMIPHQPAPVQRAVGKVANSLLLCGGTWQALHRECTLRGIPIEEHDAANAWTNWWNRYPVLAQYVRAWWQRGLATQHSLDLVRPDGTVDHWAPSELNGTAPRYDGLKGDRHLAAYRSVLSALWRAVESSVLDRALCLLQGVEGLRIACPTYDGCLFSVRGDRAEELAQVAVTAFETAGREAGLPTLRATVKVRESWK